MILCNVYRLKMRLGFTPSKAAVRHLRGCSACRAYEQRLARLDEQLKAGAGVSVLNEAQQAAIEARVMERLRQADASTGRPLPARGRPWRPAAFGAAAAAAMILIAAAIFMQPSKPQPQPLDIVALVELWEGSEYWTQQIPRLANLPEQSLQAELTRLTGDARRAALFLLNCAPAYPMYLADNGQ